MSKPELLYFPFAGRGAAVRLCLTAAFGKDGWEDKELAFDQFGAEKAKITAGEPSILKSGSVPQLTLPDGTTVTQSHAMCRWACKSVRNEVTQGLYPDDPKGALLVDESVAHLDEILLKTPQDPDKEVKKAKRIEFSSKGKYMHSAMSLVEGRIAESPGPFLLPAMTMADIYVAGLVAMILGGDFDYIEPSYMDQFPKLVACKEAVEGSDLYKTCKDAGMKV